MYLPSIAMVSFYFDKRRALATGLAVCGSGVGTFVLAPFFDHLVAEYGWKVSHSERPVIFQLRDYVALVAVRSIAMSVSVCPSVLCVSFLSVFWRAYLKNQMSRSDQNTWCTLPVAVARSSFGGIAMFLKIFIDGSN